MSRPLIKLFGIFALPLTLAVAARAAESTACPALPEALADASAYEPRTDGVTVKVVGRVDAARVTRGQARLISMLSPVLSAVTLSERTIRPLPGSSIWSLTNGSFAIFDSEPDPDAMDIWEKDMGDGDLYVRACLCPGSNPNVDDGCKWDNPTHPTNPGACRGNTCCKVVEGLIEGNGTPHRF